MTNSRLCIYTYMLLSMVFIIVNISTLRHLTPWIDEVMMLDTSYNAAFHGAWETTAWYRVAGEYPFSTYPPLYQMLAAVWMKLFGSDMTTVRGLNLLITFVLGAVCLRLMKHHGFQLNPWSVALFAMLFWGSSEMMWMYRNGRPDMLCALVFVFTLQSMDHYLLAKSSAAQTAVIFTSALLVCSGIQSATYLCTLWLFSFLRKEARRKDVLRLLLFQLSGLLAGLLSVSLFMMAHGRLLAFASSIIQYSATLKAATLLALPWMGEAFGFHPAPYIQKLTELSTEASLGERLASIVEYRSFVVLSVAALTGYAASSWGNLPGIRSNRGFLLLLFALYVPVAMNLAGRFAVYYRWMAYLPLIAAITHLAGRHRSWCAVFALLACLSTALGIRSLSADSHWDCRNASSFVRRQGFRPADAVICPFSLFYDMKPVCETCYFVGVFPTEFLGHVDYIIEARNGDESDRHITDYIDQLKSDTKVTLTAIDHCDNPALTLYHVQTRK